MKTHTSPRSKYLVCIHNAENPASLELRKIYRSVRAQSGDPASMVRIVDESGEDYLYPRAWFMPISVSRKLASVFAT